MEVITLKGGLHSETLRDSVELYVLKNAPKLMVYVGSGKAENGVSTTQYMVFTESE